MQGMRRLRLTCVLWFLCRPSANIMHKLSSKNVMLMNKNAMLEKEKCNHTRSVTMLCARLDDQQTVKSLLFLARRLLRFTPELYS